MHKNNELNNRSSIRLSEGIFQDRIRTHRRQSERRTQFNLLVLLDLGLISLLFCILFTRFVTLPGMEINFLSTDLRINPISSQVTILTVKNEDTLFFEGKIHNLSTIESSFKKHLKSKGDNISLLIRSDSKMDLDSFLNLCSIAQRSGFNDVQIMAVEKSNLKEF